jgi:transposase
VHYRDTSRMRQLECANFGCLSVSAERVNRQFGSLLNTIQLPGLWQDVVLQECYEIIRENGTEQLMDQRSKLEAEKKGLVMAFAKGYISEEELDIEIARVRSTLLSLPRVRGYGSGEEYGQHAIAVGKSLMEAANCWISGTSTERRDLVWSMLDLNGLVYDLQRQCIVGIKPRDVALPALKLGLQEHWRLHDQGLWLREEYIDIYAATGKVELGDALRSRGRRLGADQWQEAKHLLQEGMPPQEVARHFHVSTWVILRLIQRDEPERTAQQQPKLGAEQQLEAMEMLRQGKSLRQVAARFHVSRMAIWRMVHRAVEEVKFQGQ